MGYNVRILGIKLKNIKNIKNGEIELDSFKDVKKGNFDLKNSDVVGIYGPNGSGKSTIVDSFNLIKKIILNNTYVLLNNLYDLMNIESNESSIEITFLDDIGTKRIYFYEITFNKNNESKKGFIRNESLSFKEYDSKNKKYLSKNKLFDIDYLNEDLNNIVRPIQTLNLIKKHHKNNFLALVKILTTAETSTSSFIFNQSFIDLLSIIDEFKIVSNLLLRFKSFLNYSMHIFTLESLNKVNSNNIYQIIYELDGKINKFNINFFSENIINIKEKPAVNIYLKKIDSIINKIIPSMHIELLNLGNVALEKGEIGFKFELISIRDKAKIPLRLESNGIKKIILLINSLIDIYNDKYSILIVDDLDIDMFEYLLGELVKGIKEDAKGILIFTAHNLRALELIKESIIFTSTNENERYITFPRISKTENLRNQYLKKIFLNDSNEYSNHFDTYEISKSFIKAGNIKSE